jgi:methylated-DNA-protein-cysteine methyltransferase related protein
MNVSHNAKPPVPAHRVLNRNGLLSGQAHFPGPGEMQRRLEAEGHSVSQNKVDRFEEVFWDPNLELSL